MLAHTRIDVHHVAMLREEAFSPNTGRQTEDASSAYESEESVSR